MPLRNLKYLFLLLPSLSLANIVTGIGEYHYGPDTDENTACEYAFQRSKNDAIQRQLGEEIESFTLENCESETKCKLDVETYTQMFGSVKQIIKKDISKYEDYGQKICKVIIDAVVERIDNKIKFSVNGKIKYVENEELDFKVISNEVGYVSIYNFYKDYYTKIHEFYLEQSNKEIKISKKGERMVAVLPKNENQSKEMLVFIFSKDKPDNKKKFNIFEFSSMISSLDSKNKRTVFRYVTIGKKL